MEKDLSFLIEAESFVQSHFSFGLEQSKLKICSQNEWNSFCSANNFDKRTDGLYVPQSLTAYVNKDSQTFISDSFHELFGHGLFCENSSLHKKNLEERMNPQGIFQESLLNYEGFAVWTEKLLCTETDNVSSWKKKEASLPSWYLQALDGCEQFIHQFSEFEFLAQMGFPKKYDTTDLLTIVKSVYGSSMDSVDLVMHYGSGKPTSDIDLFVVSTNATRNYSNGWLDIYEVNRNDFALWSKNLDLSVTDPLFSGKLVFGNKPYVDTLKEKITNRSVDATVLSFYDAEIKRMSTIIPKNTREEFYKSSYLESYSLQREQLAKGNSLFTLADLKKYVYK